MCKFILCALAMLTFGQAPIQETQPIVRYADEPVVTEPHEITELVFTYDGTTEDGIAYHDTIKIVEGESQAQWTRVYESPDPINKPTESGTCDYEFITEHKIKIGSTVYNIGESNVLTLAEDRVLTYVEGTSTIKITLKADGDAHVSIVEDGKATSTNTNYELLEDGKVKINSGDGVDYVILTINELNEITNIEVVEPNLPPEVETPTEPTEPKFEKVKYTYTDKNGVYYEIWLLDKENVQVQFTINNDQEIIEGVYLKIRNLLYISVLEGTELGCFFELNDSEGTFLPYVPPISKDDNDNLQFRNETMQRIWNILNQPLPIVGFSILMIGGWVFLIVIKGAWGKKSIKKLTDGFARNESNVDAKIKAYDKREAIREAKVNVMLKVIMILVNNTRNVNVKELANKELSELKVKEKEILEDGKETNEGKETFNNSSKEA